MGVAVAPLASSLIYIHTSWIRFIRRPLTDPLDPLRTRYPPSGAVLYTAWPDASKLVVTIIPCVFCRFPISSSELLASSPAAAAAWVGSGTSISDDWEPLLLPGMGSRKRKDRGPDLREFPLPLDPREPSVARLYMLRKILRTFSERRRPYWTGKQAAQRPRPASSKEK